MALGLLLAACSNDGLTLARQACTYVDRSIRLYSLALKEQNAVTADAERRQAMIELETAIPLAAQANSADPQWNPLMTTLQESRRNELSNLIPALRAQCHQASLPNEQAPVPNNVPTGGGGSGGPGSTSGAGATPPSSTPSTVANPRLP